LLGKSNLISEFGTSVPFMCNFFTVLSSYSFIGHYMFRPNWPSAGVQVVVVKDTVAHCNAVVFPSIVVASAYFSFVG
jgi:hypothetical protein